MIIGERLKEALAKKENDINSFVWKGQKVKNSNGDFEQTEKRLVDCSIDELKSFYRHCESMLYNSSKDNPGRYPLLEIIEEQRLKCNAELFLRWLSEEKGIPKFSFLSSVNEFLKNNPSVDRVNGLITEAVGGCPPEFQNLTIGVVLDACLDSLGKFSKQHITLAFLLKQGVWASEEEKEELNARKIKLTPDYIREYLDLKPTANVRVNSKGLSLAQMKAMISLKSKKYSEMSTTQLKTLRNRILFSLENDVRFHIQQWETRELQIKMVLESKGCKL